MLSCYLSKLIARYNSAKDAMKRLLASDQDLEDSQIISADQELNAAFEAIMQAEIQDALEAQARIRFIAELINERCEDQIFVKGLTDKILDDVKDLSEKLDPHESDVVQQAG